MTSYLRFLLIYIFFHFLFNDLQSQTVYYAETGLVMSRMSPNSPMYSDIKLKYTPMLGFSKRKGLVRNMLYSHVGIYYNRIGERMVEEQKYRNYIRTYDLQIDYLKIPVKIEVKFYNFQILTGVFLSRAFAGNIKYQTLDYSTRATIYKHETEFRPIIWFDKTYNYYYIKKWNVGYNLAVGYKIENLSFLLSYEKGKRIINEEEDSHSVSNVIERRYYFIGDDGNLVSRCLKISVIYYFGNKYFK